jgi:hypothetical protein
MRGKKKIKGLGDVVSAVTTFVGIVPCEACEERRKKWNLLFPSRSKPRELTEKELCDWKTFKDNNPTLDLENNQRLFLCKIYSDVFQVPYYEPCLNCSPRPYMVMVERMDMIYKTY